jgi:hypothetical protein
VGIPGFSFEENDVIRLQKYSRELQAAEGNHSENEHGEERATPKVTDVQVKRATQNYSK